MKSLCVDSISVDVARSGCASITIHHSMRVCASRMGGGCKLSAIALAMAIALSAIALIISAIATAVLFASSSGNSIKSSDWSYRGCAMALYGLLLFCNSRCDLEGRMKTSEGVDAPWCMCNRPCRLPAARPISLQKSAHKTAALSALLCNDIGHQTWATLGGQLRARECGYS